MIDRDGPPFLEDLPEPTMRSKNLDSGRSDEVKDEEIDGDLGDGLTEKRTRREMKSEWKERPREICEERASNSPRFPEKRKNSWEDPSNGVQGETDGDEDDGEVHQRAGSQLVKLSEGSSLDDLSNGLEGRVLRISEKRK